MNRAMPLVQSSSGMIHVEGCDRIFHDARAQPDLWIDVPVQRDEIHAIGPYSRCSHCEPDVPEHMPDVVTTLKGAGDLTRGDVGRITVLGTISVVVHGAHGVLVIFDDGIQRTFAPAENLPFVAGQTVPQPH